MAKRVDNQTGPLSAADLVSLLAERHSDDIFVPECKNGPTHSAERLLRLDAWASKKSWAHPCTYAYEVKVSRSDFEQDQKWVHYLPLCHEFYFVCPAGLIRASDLTLGAGLIWATVNGSRLVTKVKAERHEPDAAQQSLLIDYVLMCRARIVADMWEANGRTPAAEVNRLESIRKDVERAEARKELCVYVNQHVRSRFAEKEAELHDMRSRVEVADAVREELAKAGVPWPENGWGSWETRRLINERTGRIPGNIVRDLQSARAQLDRLIESLAARSEAAE